MRRIHFGGGRSVCKIPLCRHRIVVRIIAAGSVQQYSLAAAGKNNRIDYGNRRPVDDQADRFTCDAVLLTLPVIDG